MLLQTFTLENTDKTKLIDVQEGREYKSSHSIYARNSSAEPANLTFTQTFQDDEVEIFNVSLEANQTNFKQVHNLKFDIEPNSFVSAISTRAGVVLTLLVSDHVV